MPSMTSGAQQTRNYRKGLRDNRDYRQLDQHYNSRMHAAVNLQVV